VNNESIKNCKKIDKALQGKKLVWQLRYSTEEFVLIPTLVEPLDVGDSDEETPIYRGRKRV
jgi:hypothetical protein